MIAFSEGHDILNERAKVDRRRIEAFFQYALLRVTSWYPEQLSLSSLPLHNKTTEILPSTVSVYHGAFMKKYAGNVALIFDILITFMILYKQCHYYLE